MWMQPDNESGHLSPTAFCSEHSEADRAPMDHDLYFAVLRARGLTQSVSTAQIHRRERVLDLVADHLETDSNPKRPGTHTLRRDLYLAERCAACFGDGAAGGDDAEMRQCTNCRIWLHRGCYLEVL